MTKWILIIIFLVSSDLQQAFAENKHKIDSLLSVLKTQKEDSNKVNTLLAISEEHLFSNNFNLSLPFINSGMALANKLNFLKGKIEANIDIGMYHGFSNDKYQQLKSFHTALRISEAINDKNKIAEVYEIIGNFYRSINKLKESKMYFSIALSINKETGNLYSMARDYYRMGQDNSGLKNDSSTVNYLMGITIGRRILQTVTDKRKITEAKEIIGRCYNNIGNNYAGKHQNSKALIYFDSALVVNKEIENLHGIAGNYDNMAGIYVEQKKYDKALEYLLNAFELWEPLQSPFLRVVCVDIANLYLTLNNPLKAKYYFKKAIELSTKGMYENVYELKSEIYKNKIIIDSIDNNCKQTVLDYKQYVIFKDSALNIENENKALQEGLNFNFEKKQAIDKAKSDEEIERQKIVRNSFIVGFILILIIAIGVFRSLQQNRKAKAIITKQKEEVEKQKEIVEHQKKEVEQKNTEILDSIEYAKRIQNTILPPQKIVSQYLENSFILYLPKDIVAGDFYWMSSPTQPPLRGGAEELNKNNELISSGKVLPLGEDLGGAILFAACDCTGHGVPGAMVSVVCSNALNKAVKEFGLTEPAKILDKVAELVIEDLSKNNDVGDEIQDGMDASLASLNTTTGELQWAGANNALYIVPSSLGGSAELEQNEITTKQSQTSEEIASGFANLRNDELTEVKPDKQPIGKFDNPKPFTNHTIQLQKGDTIYLFTDGYADQFGGPKGKKYSKGKFKELLLSINHLPMNEQREALYNAHIQWRNTQEQVDDICVIGVRV